MSTRRKFLSNAGLGLAGAALAAPAVHTSAKSTIKWRMQTYAGASLAEHVVKPAVDSFNRIAGSDMQMVIVGLDPGGHGLHVALEHVERFGHARLEQPAAHPRQDQARVALGIVDLVPVQ